jgi:geranylgeranyl pyrophosphate synthase
MKSVVLDGKIIDWLIGPVYQAMQEREKFAQLSEDDAMDWGNDIQLYQQVLDDMLDACGMTLRELQYEYGDLKGEKCNLPHHAEIDEEAAMQKVLEFWKRNPNSERAMRAAVIAEEAEINYPQVKRLLVRHFKYKAQ